MSNGENPNEKFSNLFEKILNSYKRTGKIGYVKPYNLEHAKKVAYMAVKRIITTSSSLRQPTEGLTSQQTCYQLKLF